MHIEVMSRREAVQLCYKPSGGRKVSMISISTPGDAYESHPVVKNGIKAILFVSFFDVTEGSQGQVNSPQIKLLNSSSFAEAGATRTLSSTVMQGCPDRQAWQEPWRCSLTCPRMRLPITTAILPTALCSR